MAEMPRRIGTRFGSPRSWHPASVGRRAVPLAGLVLAMFAAPLSAQVRIGGHGLYRNELLASGFGAGARVEFDLGFIMPQLGLGAVYSSLSRDCTDCSYREVGGQVTLGEGTSYIGLNALVARIEGVAGDETTRTDEWKLSVVVGFRLLSLPLVVPFLEARQALGSGLSNDQALILGILVGPARARQAPRAPAPR